MASAEYNLETLVIAILTASATFSGVDIEHHSEDESTTGKNNRLTVRADPATPKVAAFRPDRKAPVWQSVVTITAQGSMADTTFDAWWDAIDDAMMPASFSAGLITTATGLFPNGIVIESASGGSVFDGPSKRRTLTRTFPVVFRY
jgi:hypothetical protein